MPITFAVASERFLEHCRISKRLSPNTIRAYDTDFCNFLSYFGKERGVSSVDREVLRHYAATQFDHRRLKESTVKRRMAALKVLFRWLEQEEVIELSPFHRLNFSIRLPRRLPRALTTEEMRRLLRAAEASSHEGHDQLLLHFAILCLFITGLRIGELTSVTMQDVDVIGSSILVRGKGNKERRVFLTGKTANTSLSAYLKSREQRLAITERLLISENGLTITPQGLRRQLAALAKRARIERRVTPHMLRHTAATQLIEAGVDIRFVQKLLGHASIATTQIYTQVSDTSLRDTMLRADTLSRVMGGKSG